MGKFKEGKENAQNDPALITAALNNNKTVTEFLPQIYSQLKAIAGKAFSSESPSHTLQPTALVNEAYERLSKLNLNWESRSHFFAVSARMMRRILVDHARAKLSEKRGGKLIHTQYEEHSLQNKTNKLAEDNLNIEILALEEALSTLSESDSRKVEILELFYFGGLNYSEIAEELSISPATVDRELRFAKVWLKTQLEK